MLVLICFIKKCTDSRFSIFSKKTQKNKIITTAKKRWYKNTKIGSVWKKIEKLSPLRRYMTFPFNIDIFCNEKNFDLTSQIVVWRKLSSKNAKTTCMWCIRGKHIFMWSCPLARAWGLGPIVGPNSTYYQCQW